MPGKDGESEGSSEQRRAYANPGAPQRREPDERGGRREPDERGGQREPDEPDERGGGGRHTRAEPRAAHGRDG